MENETILKLKLISVYNNCGWAKIEKELKENVLSGIYCDQKTYILGDLNSRIGVKQGCADAEEEEEEEFVTKRVRFAKDKKLNKEGGKMLEFCEEVGAVVLNGRAPGDEKGEYTWLGGGGCGSTIDYVLELEDCRDSLVDHLEVSIRSESDHFPISCSLKVGLSDRQVEEKFSEAIPKSRLKWKKEKEEEYREEVNEIWKKETQGKTGAEEWNALKLAIAKGATQTGMTESATRERKKKEGPEWFDKKCKEARAALNKRIKNYLNFRTEKNKTLWKKSKGKWIKIKKDSIKEWWGKRWKKVATAKNRTEWWRALNGFRKNNDTHGEGIKKEDWVEHFKNLLGGGDTGTRQKHTHTYTRTQHRLDEARKEDWFDEDFDVLDMYKGINKLKNGKAEGEDGIKGEFIKQIDVRNIVKITKMVNNLRGVDERLPEGWKKALILPIFKNGEENDTNNYRGISFLDAGYKLVTGMEMERISTWIEKEKKLKESQGGFRAGRGTIDQIFVLNSLIDNRLSEKGGRLYIAFVDFKAAFDKVDREIMLEKIWKKGIRGKSFGLIEKIYGKTTCAIKTREGESKEFEIGKGVRQGCVMSPMLFAIYIDDLDEEFEKKKQGGTWMGGTRFTVLKYADDIALLAEEPGELRKMLKTLEKYAGKNKLEVNVQKTKVMVCKNRGREKKGWQREIFKYKGEDIEEVKQFKYLGFTFTAGGSVREHVRQTAGKIQRVINKTWGVMKRARINNLKDRLILLEAIARAGFMYGGEIWGWDCWDDVNKVQGRYVKMALGVSVNTATYLWKREAGKLDAKIMAEKTAIKYLLKVADMEEDRWPKICLRELLRKIDNRLPTKWGKKIGKVLKSYGVDKNLKDLMLGQDRMELIRILEKGIKKNLEEDVEKDWEKIEKSNYCKYYKEIEKERGTNYPEFWDREDIQGWEKEIWSRIRVGNIPRDGKSGYKKWDCRLCGEERETLRHIVECTKAREQLSGKMRAQLDEWKEGKTGRELRNHLIKTLRSAPVRPLCILFKKFEEKGRESEEALPL